MQCSFCGTEAPEGSKIFRSTLCAGCGRELRICLNCDFYSPGAHWDCRETVGEPVADKERANFCDYFRPAASGPKTKRAAASKENHARSDFDKLFGNS